MSASGRLRVGVVGCASIAWRRTLPALVSHDRIALVALASRDAEKAARFAARFGGDPVVGFEPLLARADIDAVYIPVATGLHATWAGAALEAGKHVLVEKPLAVDHAEASGLADLARSRGLVLMENAMFLRHRQHADIQKVLAEGAIGELRGFSAAFGVPPLESSDIRYRPELGGGALLDVGFYPLRAAQWYLGPDLDVVGGMLRKDARTGVDVAGNVLLASPAGVTAELSFGFEHSYRSCYALWGSAGRLVLDRAFTPPSTWQPVVRIAQQDRTEERVLPADDQFANSVDAFLKAVLDGHPAHARLAESLDHARLVDHVRARARWIDA